MRAYEFVIIGGGSAGYSAIKAIREEQKSASILWITDEDRLPYKRTHINKNIKSGFKREAFAMVSNEWLSEQNIELRYAHVTKIDGPNKNLIFANNDSLRFEKLIIAVGQLPKKLSIENLEHIAHVYTAQQVEDIIKKAEHATNILIVGAGVEGVETASQLVAMGKKVVLIDRSDMLLKQFFNKRFSELMANSLAEAGVELQLYCKHISYNSDSEITSIDGKNYPFDMHISTIGYEPNIQLAMDSGIACKRGIIVDENLRTSVNDIFAAGDVAQHPNGQTTGLWHAAEQQGYIAGKNACGGSLNNELPPFRMKTQVFESFYFSVPPKDKAYEIIDDSNDTITRELYFYDNKLEAALVKDDATRAKLYQKALLEGWDKKQVIEKLAL
ncbi:NAD(P)/FAD-dependent oxidoreductase [Saccharicrinis aurantiacus]|uniref:NAD(P)/FAD-dependent oxidoreductase n=1 Tax=Saccharicrinis aurantiacus TaxID=1849719 RepID=UPI00094F8185|nr:FAD/NAD(P)-binding oxidoreductase [Saccharicrinis aurantiacus]